MCKQAYMSKVSESMAHYLHDNFPIMQYMSLLNNSYGNLDILWGGLIGTQGGMKSELSLSELDIYGAKRLGVIKDTMVVNRFYFNGAYNPTSATYDITSIDTPIYNAILSSNFVSWIYGKKVFELNSHLGNVLATVSDYKIPYNNSAGKLCFNPDVRTETRYYAYGGIKDSSFNPNKYRFKYQGSEINDGVDGTFNTYYRWGDEYSCTWMSPDPIFNPSISPYNLMNLNPIWHNDVMGDYTTVSQNKDGTYKVEGGKLNNDNGIYLKGQIGKKTGLIGYSATPYSFYNSDAKRFMGTINTKDQSGRDFLNNDILKNNPNIFTYMANATGGKYYDFKRTNGSNIVKYNTQISFYRGMPILGSINGKQIYASARDIGNIGAGLIAGISGLSWGEARLGFDGLESHQKGSLVTENLETQYGQKMGFRIGTSLFRINVQNELKKLPSYGEIIVDPYISKDIIKK